MDGPELKRVEKWAWISLALASAASLALGHLALAAGFAIGGAISIMNYKWLGFFYGRVLLRGSRCLRFFAILSYIGRYLVVGAALYLVISRGLANMVSLLVGISAIYLVVAFFGFLGLCHKN